MADSFALRLQNAVLAADSLVCVGLDPDLAKLPSSLQKSPESLFLFNKAIIDATHDLVCAYKPNSAFYEAYGAVGIEELKKTCDYLHENYPGTPIILDAKRGDIGNTNRGYAQFAYEYLGVDTLTVHPYQGIGALSAFTEHEGRGIIVLCHMSNPEAKEFQELESVGKPIYMHVAEACVALHAKNPNIAMVVGATYPQELKELRLEIGDMNLLIPGIGAQGGSVKDVVENGINSMGAGLIISASRSVLYASGGDDFAEAARAEAKKLRDEINHYRPSQA